jgi:hypothetical protein
MHVCMLVPFKHGICICIYLYGLLAQDHLNVTRAAHVCIDTAVSTVLLYMCSYSDSDTVQCQRHADMPQVLMASSDSNMHLNVNTQHFTQQLLIFIHIPVYLAQCTATRFTY